METIINSNQYSLYENACSQDDDDKSCQCDSYSGCESDSANDVCSEAAARSDDE